MPKIGKTRVGGVPMDELLGSGVAKPFLEGMLTPFIGNGTVFSGAIKLGVALALPSLLGGGKLTRIGQMSLGIDGAEDLMRGLLGGFVPGLGVQASVDPFEGAM